MKPTVSRLEKEFEGKVEFQALNIDETSKDVFEKYKFIGQPQFVIVTSSGDIISSRNGMQKYETLKADIEKVLAMP
ncbi:MAG: hypothetical protein HC853_02395 [Anaerolineae bacterium]|nr:hypothetical protein [Anaerolineae bacterium]